MKKFLKVMGIIYVAYYAVAGVASLFSFGMTSWINVMENPTDIKGAYKKAFKRHFTYKEIEA